MDRQEIIALVEGMKTVDDLTTILNRISSLLGSQCYITCEDLLHYSKSKTSNRYNTFFIKKKSGGLREINAPCDKLGNILYYMNILFKSIYIPASTVTGFTEGRSVVDNAKIHTNCHYVFNIDLKDFFPSIPQARVWARLQIPPFNFTRDIANVIAGLCCYTKAGSYKGILPQGAATSPILTNAICEKLDRRMYGVAKRFGLNYSRYADDMTFSSMHNVYQENSEFRIEIKRIIEEQGFAINESKTRLFRNNVRQEVTGLTVNSKVNVSRKFISDLRWIIHIWERSGYGIAYCKFYPKYKEEKGHIKKGEPDMENVIGGKLNYLRMVKGANNPAYMKLQERFNKLKKQSLYLDIHSENPTFTYIQRYRIKDFLTKFSTVISLEVSSKGKLVGKCILADTDKTISISEETQKKLCPDLATKRIGDKVVSTLLDECHITLCNSKGQNFWLITLSLFY